MDTKLKKEITRRRTFAIISHPDAGKTTLTEKLLLYAGALEMAGSVRAGRNRRYATSDWMELERQRGISITSTVLQFEYADYLINLLDTPGHEDFSEDTYRTLIAADNAVMLIDGSKGIEAQTLKLFEVCRMRKIPIFTFINKMDRPSREPLDLLDEIETTLGIKTFPMNWPIGNGSTFKGVFDRTSRKIHLFTRTEHGAKEAFDETKELNDPDLARIIDADVYAQFKEEVELLDAAGTEYNEIDVNDGNLTPVYFGSAATNFGVKLFLDSFISESLSPTQKRSSVAMVNPDDDDFSGFVFKIQSNMDPKHRDSVAFVRVCSGRFERDMAVHHSRLGTSIRLSRPHKLFARDRDTVEVAYPGDIIGLVNPGAFQIGDTISTDKKIEFPRLPTFAPEHFAVMRCPNPEKYKQFHKALDQLLQEGAIQVLYTPGGNKSEPILAAVGKLQFEVVQYRLQSEYNVMVRLETLPYERAAWVTGIDRESIKLPSGTRIVEDANERMVVLFTGDWEMNYAIEKNPNAEFSRIAPAD